MESFSLDEENQEIRFSGSRDIYQRLERLKKYIPCLHEIRQGYIKMFLVRVAVIGFCLLLSLWIMSIVAILAGIRTPIAFPDLPDIGFQVLPSLYEKDSIANNLLAVTGSVTVLRCVFHKRGLTMLRRFCILWTILIIGRSTTLLATSYPDPSRACRTYKPPATVSAFLIESVYRPEFITCGDLMYSGHTVYFTLLGLVWSYYSVYRFEKLVWIPIGISSLILVATRLHYLNDVIIAFYLTMFTWFLYHSVATEPSLRKQCRPIYWLEKDIIEWEESHPLESSREPSYRLWT